MRVGTGCAVGSRLISNRETSLALGLDPDWLTGHTGVQTRCALGDAESIDKLSCAAIREALGSLRLHPSDLGSETVLLHIQSGGYRVMTPPTVTKLAAELGMHTVRCIGIDGACAETIGMFEIAQQYLMMSGLQRAIVSAAADFTEFIDATDRDTAGLFGVGAGAAVMDMTTGAMPTVWKVKARTWSEHSALAEIKAHKFQASGDVVIGTFGFYSMRGRELALVALRLVPELVVELCQEVGWRLDDIDLLIAHQPNPRMLRAGFKRLGMNEARTITLSDKMGNMGPASLLVALDHARRNGRLDTGTRVLLLSFGVGFSAGAIALEWP
jgi:3-oxoacyl-[acyl-carrier-protein] synthase III